MCLLFLLREIFGYVSTRIPLSVITFEGEDWMCEHSCSCIYFLEIESFGYVITPIPVSVIPFEGEDWMCEHSYSCICFLDIEFLAMLSLLLLCLLFLLRDIIGCVRTPTPVSVVCVRDRFGFLSTPTHVLVIPVKKDVWLCKHSYSCVCCLCEILGADIFVCRVCFLDAPPSVTRNVGVGSR